MAALADRISNWIATGVREAGKQGAVVGLSGGLDSAVTAALCKKALDNHVFGVIMPCDSDHRDELDALLVAAKLGIGAVTVRLDRPFQDLLDQLSEGPELARANLKPRIRMATLYYFANKLSYLVVGTGNKTELMVGYFTKYGDGGVDMLPLGGLYKTEVRGLARQLGIPNEIIGKPPSAGLWGGQTDERELDITYVELDRALQAIETGRTGGIGPQTIERVRRMVEASAHKRSCPRAFEVPG